MCNSIINFKKLLENYSVRIPIIQRDYAHGRNDEKVQKIRKNFLNSIFNALKSEKNLHLDFIYGSVIKSSHETIFTPLDGQQRLTTLFLLYCYFAKNEKNILKKFNYETRSSSREFCEELVKNIEEIKKVLPINIEEKNKETWFSEQIKNRSWFMSFWDKDPTVKSMLTMLDEICQKANEEKIDPENLNQLTFSLLKINDFGLDDDLYIKMNARGKPLNEFENFKAEIEKFLDNEFSNEGGSIAIDIDTIWTDRFFDICEEPEKTFAAMINYRDFIFEMLFYKNNASDLNEKTKIDDIEKGKNDYSKVLKSIDDLEFLKFAFANIDEILNKTKDIFDVYWDGKTPYEKKDNVCIFDDQKDNFYESGYKAKLNGSKSEKEYNVFEVMPTEKFNLDQKVYLYCLIFLLQKREKDESIINKITNIRNKHNDKVLFLRSNSVSFEINMSQHEIAKYISELEEELIKNVTIDEYTKKNTRL